MSAEDRLRVGIKQSIQYNAQPTLLAWATPAEDGNGYTLIWDDGFKDYEHTRWHFEGDGQFDLMIYEGRE